MLSYTEIFISNFQQYSLGFNALNELNEYWCSSLLYFDSGVRAMFLILKDILNVAEK